MQPTGKSARLVQGNIAANDGFMMTKRWAVTLLSFGCCRCSLALGSRSASPRTTCLYSADSIVLRRLPAARQSLSLKPSLVAESGRGRFCAGRAVVAWIRLATANRQGYRAIGPRGLGVRGWAEKSPTEVAVGAVRDEIGREKRLAELTCRGLRTSASGNRRSCRAKRGGCSRPRALRCRAACGAP